MEKLGNCHQIKFVNLQGHVLPINVRSQKKGFHQEPKLLTSHFGQWVADSDCCQCCFCWVSLPHSTGIGFPIFFNSILSIHTHFDRISFQFKNNPNFCSICFALFIIKALVPHQSSQAKVMVCKVWDLETNTWQRQFIACSILGVKCSLIKAWFHLS